LAREQRVAPLAGLDPLQSREFAPQWPAPAILRQGLSDLEAQRLAGVRWGQGCFAQDAVGDWWLCLSVQVAAIDQIAPERAGLVQVADLCQRERARFSVRRCARHLADARHGARTENRGMSTGMISTRMCANVASLSVGRGV
jgi:hypothetical protein